MSDRHAHIRKNTRFLAILSVKLLRGTGALGNGQTNWKLRVVELPNLENTVALYAATNKGGSWFLTNLISTFGGWIEIMFWNDFCEETQER